MTISRAEPLPLPASGFSWARGLGTLGAAFLGLVLLVAAWAKALDPLAFAQQIHSEKLDFLLSAPAVALLALGGEDPAAQAHPQRSRQEPCRDLLHRSPPLSTKRRLAPERFKSVSALHAREGEHEEDEEGRGGS